MKAFNKRFRPTTAMGGFTIPTIASFLGGILLFVFAFGMFVQTGKLSSVAFFLIGAVMAWSYAIDTHRKLKIARIRHAIAVGKTDCRLKTQEL